jgi:aminopeptidase-like protein
MNIFELRPTLNFEQLGQAMYELVTDLYPICRSITGEGTRETLRRIQKHVPLTMHEVPTGTQVFDWVIPKEWNIRDAYIANSRGERVVDFRECNLHVWNYSVPVKKTMSLSDLKPHLATLPEHPDWIPYRTSYYKEAWGFCLSQRKLESLSEDMYEVCIDSSLEPGALTYGEYEIHGQTKETVFLSAHCCHPSLCNDNLCGIATATFLAQLLAPLSLRYSYRFVFAPGTIGAITWLAKNESHVASIRHGFVVAGGGDSGPFFYKRSRREAAEIDRAVEHVLKHSGAPYEIIPFVPYGYDERQYCSPGFNLPVGALSRTPHGQFPEYHTSADNLEFVKARHLSETLRTYLSVISVLEGNQRYKNLNPKCEAQLGKRGLYRTMGGLIDQPLRELAMLWVLNLSDGDHRLLDIADRAGLQFDLVREAADALRTCGLLEELDQS